MTAGTPGRTYNVFARFVENDHGWRGDALEVRALLDKTLEVTDRATGAIGLGRTFEAAQRNLARAVLEDLRARGAAAGLQGIEVFVVPPLTKTFSVDGLLAADDE